MKTTSREVYVVHHKDFNEWYHVNKERLGLHGYIVNGLFAHHQNAYATFTSDDGRQYIILYSWNAHYNEVTSLTRRIINGVFKRDGFLFKRPAKEVETFDSLLVRGTK